MKLGFCGFGEAAFEICRGFKEYASLEIGAWSKTRYPDLYNTRCEECGVTQFDTLADLCRWADIVLVTVPSSQALDIAKEAAPLLRSDTLYIDLTAAPPKAMKSAAELVEKNGVHFVDGAMLETVPKFRNKVPTVISGSGADEAIEDLSPYGVRFTKVSDIPGDASAIKMIRSLFTKSLLAATIEAFDAAYAVGVEDYLMESLSKSMDAKTFLEATNNRLTGGIVHATRRAIELEEAEEWLTDLKVDTSVAKGAVKKLKTLSDMDFRSMLQGKRPKDWREVMTLIGEKKVYRKE